MRYLDFQIMKNNHKLYKIIEKIKIIKMKTKSLGIIVNKNN